MHAKFGPMTSIEILDVHWPKNNFLCNYQRLFSIATAVFILVLIFKCILAFLILFLFQGLGGSVFHVHWHCLLLPVAEIFREAFISNRLTTHHLVSIR
jgi:flagellar biosynthesis protein FlhB